jgi:hypothetical protein
MLHVSTASQLDFSVGPVGSVVHGHRIKLPMIPIICAPQRSSAVSTDLFRMSETMQSNFILTATANPLKGGASV